MTSRSPGPPAGAAVASAPRQPVYAGYAPSFPNRMDPLVKTSGHLTPEMLKRELDKVPPDVPGWIFHVKPQLYQESAEELAKIDSTRIHILEQGKSYTL